MPKKQNQGFTLLELIVVLIVLAGLATLGIQQYQNMVWKSRFAEAYQNVGILVRAENIYYMMHGVYAKADNPSPQFYLGNGYAAGSTDIQKQLGVGFPQNSIFIYEVTPNVTVPTTTRIYVYCPGYNWCAYYDYVAKTWGTRSNPDSYGPGCKYFVPPQG